MPRRDGGDAGPGDLARGWAGTDVVTLDVAREAASDVIAQLRALGADGQGGLAIEQVDDAPSRTAARAEEAAPGSPDDGISWDVEARARTDARSSWSFYAFLSLTTTIAAVAVITNSAVLVVGAMVVGPEFGPVSALADAPRVAGIMRQLTDVGRRPLGRAGARCGRCAR